MEQQCMQERHFENTISGLEDCFSNVVGISSPTEPRSPSYSEYQPNTPKSSVCSSNEMMESVECSEQPKKKCKYSQFKDNAINMCNSIKSKLHQMAIQTCKLKMQRLNIVKEILENQDNPQVLQELKPKHQELLTQEQKLCSEINILKTHQTPPNSPNRSLPSSPPMFLQSPPNSPTPSTTPVPCSSQSQFENQPSSCSSGLRKVWSGKLRLENCPKNNCKPKEVAISAFAPNVCGPNLAPLFAQFEGNSNGCATTWPQMLNISGVCFSNNLHFFKKFSLRIFILMPEPADADFFSVFCEKLTQNHWAGVVDLPENTLLLTPFQEKILAIVLCKMNVTLALRNAQLQNNMAIDGDAAFSMSLKYHKSGEINFEDRLGNGFFDPGRVENLLPLEEYMAQPVHEGREVLLLDSTKDCKLSSYVQRAEELLNNFADMQSQVRVLALFVSNCFGGDFPSSCASAAQINQVKISKQSNVVSIGEVTSGVCRHRAILYKYLCDRFGIPCELKRGTYHVDSDNSGAHAWNVIRLGMQYFVVDIMHEPTQLHSIDSEKAKNYTQDTPAVTKRNWIPVVRPELSHRRFLRLPNLREKAVFHEKLGRGNSTVYRITLGGLSCALKKIDIGKMTEQQRQYAIQEVSIMEMLQHENIIHYLGHELLEDKKELHILMELFPLSLGQLIDRRRKQGKKFRTQEIKHLAIEILNGIDYLHNQKIIHRDLKPDNILVDLDENDQVNKVKITDFGVSKILTDNANTEQTRVGTELYMAPEQSDPKLPSCRIDIWSFGIILLELLTLQPAYFNFQKEVAVEMIKQGIPPSIPENLACDEKRVVDIIKSCLQKEPEKRPSAEQLVLAFFRLQCYGS